MLSVNPEILENIKQENEGESDADSDEYEFQFVITDEEYTEIMKRIISEDSDIEVLGDAKPQCQICKKLFSRTSTLRRHMVIHDPNYSRQDTCTICEVCGKMIRGVMSTHLRVHSDQKPYVCELCSKAFRTKGALKIHLSLHTGERPFSCSFCLKTFTKKHTLQVHLTQHDNKMKAFKCEVCNAGFNVEADYIKHSTTHSKPFSCEFCYRSFSHKRSLVKHQKLKHRLSLPSSVGRENCLNYNI